MRSVKIILVAAVAAAALSCGSRRIPVPIIADTGSIEALVGQWEGEYSSRETGRSGNVMFKLASANDTAYGDVVMIPRGQVVQAPGQDRAQGVAPVVRTVPEVLNIRFVRLESGHVSGTLDPYNDPDCGCRVITTFEGFFAGPNIIEGTFITRGTGFAHEPSTGKWKVNRTRAVTSGRED